MSRGTWEPDEERQTFRLQDCHLLWLPFPGYSAKIAFCNSLTLSCQNHVGPHDPTHTTHTSLTCVWFGLFPVRSPLLRESRLLSIPPGTEMVHFPGFASTPYVFRCGYPDFIGMGFPIRRPPDQSLFSGSPKLFAASHVLHRLPAPRHPPYALNNLTIKFGQFKSLPHRDALTRPWDEKDLFKLSKIYFIRSPNLGGY